MKLTLSQSIEGSLLGTAVADAWGLPFEGLPRHRVQRLLQENRYQFLFHKGMVSDDTEHTVLVLQSFLESFHLDPSDRLKRFQNCMAGRLRMWLLKLPAGAGKATVISIVKLWLGISPNHSGVFSAGNGPAMKSAIVGVLFDDPNEIILYVKTLTSMTHSDPKAFYGAAAIALAAFIAKQFSDELINEPTDIQQLRNSLTDSYEDCLQSSFANDTPNDSISTVESGENEFQKLMNSVFQSVRKDQSTEEFADSLNCPHKVTGYVYYSVPVALHAWLSYPNDYVKAVKAVILCGGDTDSTGAMVGGIIGAGKGSTCISSWMLDNLIEWPMSVSQMRLLANQTAGSLEQTKVTHSSNGSLNAQKPVDVSGFLVFIRNLLFLIIVLLHGFRRLLPPY